MKYRYKSHQHVPVFRFTLPKFPFTDGCAADTVGRMGIDIVAVDPLGPAQAELFAGWHEPIAKVVQATDAEAVSWLPIEELARPLPSFSQGRAVLLGDAAHAMTPNLGQGANQGFEDAATLCTVLRQTSDLPRALARYDTLRRPRTRDVARQSRLLGRVGQLSNPLLVRARDTVMRATPGSVARRQFRQFETLARLTP